VVREGGREGWREEGEAHGGLISASGMDDVWGGRERGKEGGREGGHVT
jgi:hypothetical protein